MPSRSKKRAISPGTDLADPPGVPSGQTNSTSARVPSLPNSKISEPEVMTRCVKVKDLDEKGLEDRLEYVCGVLDEREQRICEEFIIDYNVSAVARRVGVSRTTVYRTINGSQGAELVKLLRQEQSLRLKREADAVMMRFVEQANADMRDYAEWDQDGVYVKDSKDLPPGAGRQVAEVVQDKNGVRVKLEPRTPANLALAKINGLLVNKHEVRGGPLDMTELSPAELERIARGDQD